MSQPPAPPRPTAESVRTVAPVGAKSNTNWAVIIAALTGLPALLDTLRAIPGLDLPKEVTVTLAVISAVATWAAPYLGKREGIESSARALEASEQRHP